MKLLVKKAWMWAAGLALLIAPASQMPLAAQTIKPVVVVSIASIEETLNDIGYITAAAGSEDAGKTARFFGNAFTNGLDKTKPMGLYVVPQAGDFHAVAFVPVKDLKLVLGTFKEQLGEPREAGEGILEVGTGQTVFIKEQQGWAFVAQSKDHLSNLPADPIALLGTLPKEYNVAAKVLMRNIPQELRQLAVDEIKIGMKRALEANQGVDAETADQLNSAVAQTITQIFEEVEEIALGYAIDAQGKKTYLDFSQTAVVGSPLAKRMALLGDTKTAFGGFLQPNAAATLNLSSRYTKEDIAQALASLAILRKQALKHIDDDPNLEAEKRAPAKEVVGMIFDVLSKSVESGKADFGAVLMLEPKSISFAAGAFLADGKALEAALKRIVDLAKDEPDFPTVKLNSGSHAGITFHQITAPIPENEAEAKELLGDKLEITIGTGQQAAYISFGKGSEALLKKVIDQSAADASKAVPPLQFNIALLPILKFAASVDDNPIVPALVSTLEKVGNDKITIVAQPVPRGQNVRIQVEEGVLQVIGEAVKRFSADGL